jgi:hypothetical protein
VPFFCESCRNLTIEAARRRVVGFVFPLIVMLVCARNDNRNSEKSGVADHSLLGSGPVRNLVPHTIDLKSGSMISGTFAPLVEECNIISRNQSYTNTNLPLQKTIYKFPLTPRPQVSQQFLLFIDLHPVVVLVFLIYNKPSQHSNIPLSEKINLRCANALAKIFAGAPARSATSCPPISASSDEET